MGVQGGAISPMRMGRSKHPHRRGRITGIPGGVAEWFRQGPAKPRTAVRFRPPPPDRRSPGRHLVVPAADRATCPAPRSGSGTGPQASHLPAMPTTPTSTAVNARNDASPPGRGRGPSPAGRAPVGRPRGRRSTCATCEPPNSMAIRRPPTSFTSPAAASRTGRPTARRATSNRRSASSLTVARPAPAEAPVTVAIGGPGSSRPPGLVGVVGGSARRDLPRPPLTDRRPDRRW